MMAIINNSVPPSDHEKQHDDNKIYIYIYITHVQYLIIPVVWVWQQNQDKT